MPDAHDSGHPGDSVSLHIGAPADVLYGIVSDPAAMARLSPEGVGGAWVGGATGPEVGAVFKGRNKRGLARWSTTNRVVEAEPARAFAFETQQSGMRWTYRFEPDGDGTVVTESRAPFKARPLIAKAFAAVALGGVDDHEEELRRGMLQTLERLKALAEG